MNKVQRAFTVVLLVFSALFVVSLYRQDQALAKPFVPEIETRRHNDLQGLSDEVQMKLWSRQNPENCDEARLLICDINSWTCGFGCTTHKVVLCFLQALCTNRTFVLKSEGWDYDEKGWDHYFMPIGKCKFKGAIGSLPELSGKTSEVRITRTVYSYMFSKHGWKIPRNILGKIKSIHSDPYAWWIGQFVSYLIRLRPWVAKTLKRKSRIVRLTKSTVGLQIRWGDKVGKEAIKHPVSEYMDLASKWIQQSGNEDSKKVVYVATEQSEVWKNLEDKYHDFSFIGSGFVDRSKELDYQKSIRYGKRKNELDAILADIYFLSKCNYVVCTYSSNICRLIYELNAVHNSEPMNTIQSLDDQFYWLFRLPKLRAIVDHHADGMGDNIDLKTGDVFILMKESFLHRTDDNVLGRNRRTNVTGRVPKHKLKVIVQPLNFDL